MPAKQKLHCRSAYTPLTRSHAAARLQLRRTPRVVYTQSIKRNVLAATHDRFAFDQLPQLVAQGKGAIQNLRELLLLLPNRKQLARCFPIARSRKPRDLAFNQ